MEFIQEILYHYLWLFLPYFSHFPIKQNKIIWRECHLHLYLPNTGQDLWQKFHVFINKRSNLFWYYMLLNMGFQAIFVKTEIVVFCIMTPCSLQGGSTFQSVSLWNYTPSQLRRLKSKLWPYSHIFRRLEQHSHQCNKYWFSSAVRQKNLLTQHFPTRWILCKLLLILWTNLFPSTKHTRHKILSHIIVCTKDIHYCSTSMKKYERILYGRIQTFFQSWTSRRIGLLNYGHPFHFILNCPFCKQYS
jgi:hypothetical protein